MARGIRSRATIESTQLRQLALLLARKQREKQRKSLLGLNKSLPRLFETQLCARISMDGGSLLQQEAPAPVVVAAVAVAAPGEHHDAASMFYANDYACAHCLLFCHSPTPSLS